MQTIVKKAGEFQTFLESRFASNLSNLGKLIALFGSVISFLSFATNKLSNPSNVCSFLIVRSILNGWISQRVLVDTGGKFTSTRSYVFLAISRSAIGVTCAFAYVQAITYLDLNHFYSFINTQPIFTFWLALCFMGEIYSHDQFACTILTVLGVALVVNPAYIYFDFSDPQERYDHFFIGSLIALSGAFLKAIILIIVKKLSGESPYKTMAFFEGFRVVVPALVLVFSQDIIRFDSWTSLGYALLSGVLEWVYQVFCLLAMRYERASVIGIIETLSIVLSFSFDILVLGKPLHVGSMIGTVMIVGSALYLTTKK